MASVVALMSYFAYDRIGAAIQRPAERTMSDLLASVNANDPEHPDVSINHQEGWALSYGPSRTIIFENVETGDGPWYMKAVSREQALELWKLLAQGRVAELQGQNWAQGYGNEP